MADLESNISPFLDDVIGLSRNSCKQVKVKCHLQTSEKCRKTVTQAYRSIRNIMDGNEGIYRCIECSDKNSTIARPSIKENSTNEIKSCSLDDTFFSNIDTEFKGYILGWIASSDAMGDITHVPCIRIQAHEKDVEMILILKNKLFPGLHMTCYHCDPLEREIGFDIHSKQISRDVCKWLHIQPEIGSYTVQFPHEINENVKWAFIRGLFDGNGHIISDKNSYRRCTITSLSSQMKTDISKFCGIKNCINETEICFSGINAVDFLSKIYDDADPELRLSRKYEIYLEYLGYTPNHYGHIPRCKFVKTDLKAIAPAKNNASDEGYDLWLIGVDKKISDITTRYETGIKIKPEDGWHIEILARSSLSNTGYILANSVGLIDESYRGTLKIALTKIDPSAKDIEFPFKAVQMVLRKSTHFICDEEEDLDDTARGTGGFGSTNQSNSS